MRIPNYCYELWILLYDGRRIQCYDKIGNLLCAHCLED